MLISNSRLIGCRILSLHTADVIASVEEAIIDPNSLKIIGFKVNGPLIRGDVGNVLPIVSVREFSHLGMVVDSIDELVGEDEILKIKNVLKLDFKLVGLKVVTREKSKLGKVIDFTVALGTWEIQQIIVQRPIMKALLDPTLTIARSKIVEVDDYQVVVKSEHEKSANKADQQSTVSDFVPNFVNPFREPDFANKKKTEL